MSAVSYTKYPASKSEAWKWNPKAAAAILKAGGFAMFKAAHAWFDDADGDVPEVQSAYKLPHHILEGEGLATPWRGVVAAMAVVMGARGGLDVSDGDRRAVYDHLAKHYKEFDKEAPEFKVCDEKGFVAAHAEKGIVIVVADIDGEAAEAHECECENCGSGCACGCECSECSDPRVCVCECAACSPAKEPVAEAPQETPMPMKPMPANYAAHSKNARLARKSLEATRWTFGAITKDAISDGPDADTCIIEAIASTDGVDRGGDIVDQDSLAAALADYMQFGAVREMHGWQKGIGKCLEAAVVVLPGGVRGLRVKMLIGDADVVKKIRLGIYSALSIGFSPSAVNAEMADGRQRMSASGCPVYRVFVRMLLEISVVDSPMNVECVVEGVKSVHKALVYRFEKGNPPNSGEKEEDHMDNHKTETSAPSWMERATKALGDTFGRVFEKTLSDTEKRLLPETKPEAKAEGAKAEDVNDIVTKAVDAAVAGAAQKFAIAAEALEKANADLAAELEATKAKAAAAEAEAEKTKTKALEQAQKAKAIVDGRVAFQAGVAEDADNLDAADGIKAHIRKVARGEVVDGHGRVIDPKLALKAAVAAGLDEGWIDASAMQKA